MPLLWNWQPPFGVNSLVIAQTSYVMIRNLRRVLFFVAFTAYLLVQVMLVGMIPAYYWPSRAGFILFLAGLLLIGASGYIAHRRITRERYNRTEAGKWLTFRVRPRVDYSRRIKAAKRWVIWLPTAVVMIAFLFFPETWAVVSHLSHPSSGRLLGYRVSIPANWVVLTDEPDIGSSHTWSSVAAFQSKGVLRAGATAYWRREPPIANMSFYAAPLGDRRPRFLPNDKIISTRTLPLGRGTITCSEYIPGCCESVRMMTFSSSLVRPRKTISMAGSMATRRQSRASIERCKMFAKQTEAGDKVWAGYQLPGTRFIK